MYLLVIIAVIKKIHNNKVYIFFAIILPRAHATWWSHGHVATLWGNDENV